MPQGVVENRFSELITAENLGDLYQSYNSKRPLDFSHIIIMKTLGIFWSRDVQARLIQQMKL